MKNKLTVTINKTELPIKEYQGERVVTLKEIDAVHERPEGTARRNFNAIKKKDRLLDKLDFFKISADEFRTHFDPNYSKQAVEDVILITESGYLMLVKSFTDDLAWTVQRQLVNTYFQATPNQRQNAAKQTKAQAPKRPALSSVNGAMKLTIDAMKSSGVAPEFIVLAVAKTYAPYGIVIPEDCLPEGEKLFECETIATELGIMSESGKPHKQAVSAIIGLVGVSEDEVKVVPFATGHYSNDTRKYKASVMQRIAQWLEEHGYPTAIRGLDGKTYKVKYKNPAA